MSAKLPPLGVGLGFREPYRTDLFLDRNAADFLEITADHYLDAPAEKRAELSLLAAHFPVIPHGLRLSLGSAEALNEPYLEQLAKLVEELKPAWWSEHVAFTQAGGCEIGHLAPVPLTAEALRALVRNVRAAQARVPTPLIVENITWAFAWKGGEMSEPEFLTRLVHETGCGLLLDVTNLHINARNYGYDARAFLDALPVERIVQLHFVGEEERGGTLLDTHAQATTPAIWALVEEVLARAPVKGAILERDDRLPPFEELVPELERARAIGRKHARWR